MNLHIKIFACIFLMSLSADIFSQQKIAYIDADAIIKSMPDYRIIRGELEIFQKQWLKQLDEEKKAIAHFYTSIIERVKRGELTPQEQQDAENELQKKQQVLEQRTNEADQQLLAKEKLLSKSMYDKFEAALKSVAKANNYTYVFDKKLLRYYAGGIDASEKMKKALKIE